LAIPSASRVAVHSGNTVLPARFCSFAAILRVTTSTDPGGYGTMIRTG
jgi:hypothetical protein